MSQPPAPSRPEPQKTLSSGQLEVVFHWEGDRWVHSLHLRQPDGSRGPACWQTAQALPGDDPAWPSSPALVELAEVTGPQGSALVAVGKAGKNHFSASITADGEDGLRFEIACRLGPEAGWVGSTYVPSRNTTSLDSRPLLTIDPVQGRTLQDGAETGGLLRNGLLQIVPMAADASLGATFPRGSTVQWSYRVRAGLTG
jgi:hypothetical protein